MTQLLEYLSEKYPQNTFDEVNRRLLELSSLFEFSQLINSSLELEKVLNNIMLIPMGRMMISRGLVLLKQQNRYQVIKSKGLPESVNKISLDEADIPKISTPFIFLENETEVPDSPLIEIARKFKFALIIPLVNNSQPLGFIFFGSKLNNTKFGNEEINFLKLMANLSSTAIGNALQLQEIKQINRQLDEKIQELRTLFDIARGLSATLDANQILRLLVYAIMGQMVVTKYAVIFAKDNRLYLKEFRNLNPDLLEGTFDELTKLTPPDTALAISNLSDTLLSKKLAQCGVRIVVPMQHQENFIGYLLLGEKISQQDYTETDLEFLTTLVNQAVTSLENARLFKETLEKQRMEEELNVARNIQKKLLPKTFPSIGSYEIYGVNHSSKQVGGDYFDIISLDNERIALAIGDVSGKGVPASLLMANLQAALRVLIKINIPLNEVVSRLNHLIYENTETDKFITFFVAILNINTHELEYVNAGHNNPVLRKSNDELIFLDKGGLILGVLPDYTYEVGYAKLQPGDILLTYTDGVNEAINEKNDEWGEAALYDLLRQFNKNEPIQKLIDQILSAIDQFAGSIPQADDVTMLGIKRR
jgi:sigma-B regulation protein RsbU (phosphoserine phosphatase)